MIRKERELTEAQERLIAACDARDRVVRMYDDLIKSLRDAVVEEGCDHPETVPYTWEHDDGYGTQSPVTGKRCVFCGASNPWGGRPT